MAALIEDHGIIGDLHTAALVSTDRDIDLRCLPRFDSPSVFASILDEERGGGFTVRCTGQVDVDIRCAPAFDYGRARTEVEIVGGSGAFCFSPIAQLVLRSTVPLAASNSWTRNS
jgi:hypothetical protein